MPAFFVWCPVGGRVDKVVMEEHRVEEGCRPELRREAGPIEEGADLDCKGVVVDLCASILGRAVRYGGFHNIAAVL
jgi:hypothetical protein